MGSMKHNIERGVEGTLLVPIIRDPCGGKEVTELRPNLELPPYELDVPIQVLAKKKHTYVWECVSFTMTWSFYVVF